jgi:hypothetical protein
MTQIEPCGEKRKLLVEFDDEAWGKRALSVSIGWTGENCTRKMDREDACNPTVPRSQA